MQGKTDEFICNEEKWVEEKLQNLISGYARMCLEEDIVPNDVSKTCRKYISSVILVKRNFMHELNYREICILFHEPY